MREIALALVVTAAALAAPVSAQIYDHNTHLPSTNHSMLAHSNPADGAVLDEAPQAQLDVIVREALLRDVDEE